MLPKKAVYLVEIEWDSYDGDDYTLADLELDLSEHHSIKIFGRISPSEVDAAYLKLRQLSAETERQAPIEDRIHSAHKALAFFADMIPTKFWKEIQRGKNRV